MTDPVGPSNASGRHRLPEEPGPPPPAETGEPSAVWLSIAEGYARLPLTDIPEAMAATGRIIDELGTPAQRATSGSVLEMLGAMLETLAAAQAVYCGVGRHESALNGQVVTSTLVVSLLEFEGRRNPRLVLKDLIIAKRDADESGAVDVVDLPNGPVMFFERTLLLPTPPAAGQHVLAEGTESPVWQIEAFVPSPEGDKLATIEISTPFVDHGPLYRGIAVGMASTVLFRQPPKLDALAALLG